MGPLSSTDVIPPLRHNLYVGGDTEGLGDGLLSVTNLSSGEELQLRGFELSLARLLDGHRTAREIIEAAERIGLPLTLGALEGFVNRLAAVDLVGEDDEGTPFRPRDAWDDATRTGYRTALREARAGHLRASADALDRVIAKAPWEIEAVKLRQRLSDRNLPSFPKLFADAQKKWLSMVDDGPLPRLGPARLGVWFVFVAGVLGLLAAAFVPLPRTVNAPAVLLPISTARVTAPRTAPIERVAVQLGQRVAEGDLLFTYDAASTVAALEQAQARVEKQRAELARGWKALPADEPARIRYEQAQAALAQAQARLDQQRAAGADPFADSSRPLQDAADVALDELHQSESALLAEGPAEQAETLHRFEAEAVALEDQLRGVEVRAPQAGEVTHLAAKAGETLVEGTDAVQIDETEILKVVAAIDPADLAGILPGRPAELVAQDHTVPATITRVEDGRAIIEIDNATHALAPGAGELVIRARPRPLIPLGWMGR